jgi:hypothetical protein
MAPTKRNERIHVDTLSNSKKLSAPVIIVVAVIITPVSLRFPRLPSSWNMNPPILRSLAAATIWYCFLGSAPVIEFWQCSPSHIGTPPPALDPIRMASSPISAFLMLLPTIKLPALGVDTTLSF